MQVIRLPGRLLTMALCHDKNVVVGARGRFAADLLAWASGSRGNFRKESYVRETYTKGDGQSPGTLGLPPFLKSLRCSVKSHRALIRLGRSRYSGEGGQDHEEDDGMEGACRAGGCRAAGGSGLCQGGAHTNAYPNTNAGAHVDAGADVDSDANGITDPHADAEAWRDAQANSYTDGYA